MNEKAKKNARFLEFIATIDEIGVNDERFDVSVDEKNNGINIEFKNIKFLIELIMTNKINSSVAELRIRETNPHQGLGHMNSYEFDIDGKMFFLAFEDEYSIPKDSSKILMQMVVNAYDDIVD